MGCLLLAVRSVAACSLDSSSTELEAFAVMALGCMCWGVWDVVSHRECVSALS